MGGGMAERAEQQPGAFESSFVKVLAEGAASFEDLLCPPVDLGTLHDHDGGGSRIRIVAVK